MGDLGFNFRVEKTFPNDIKCRPLKAKMGKTVILSDKKHTKVKRQINWKKNTGN